MGVRWLGENERERERKWEREREGVMSRLSSTRKCSLVLSLFLFLIFYLIFSHCMILLSISSQTFLSFTFVIFSLSIYLSVFAKSLSGRTFVGLSFITMLIVIYNNFPTCLLSYKMFLLKPIEKKNWMKKEIFIRRKLTARNSYVPLTRPGALSRQDSFPKKNFKFFFQFFFFSRVTLTA